MKISKPITNEFLLSTVQFTSLNSIVFKNVKNVYEGNDKIALEYEHSQKIEASSRDWIGIFPRGWNTLQQYITFEWVSQSLPSANSEQNNENNNALVRRTMTFSPKYPMGSVNNNSFYQFVYISKQIEVLGVSSYFRFDVSSYSNNMALELECLVPVSSKIRSMSVSDFGILLGNNVPSSISLDTRTIQTASIHSLQNTDAGSKNWVKTPISINKADLNKNSNLLRKTTGTGDALNPYSSHSEPVFPMSFQMVHCKKCFHVKRGVEFWRSQQVQSKVGPRSEETSEFGSQRRTLGHEMSENKLKIVMERNKILEERIQDMKKEVEKLQAESKKLKISFYTVNKEKVAYEKFVKDFIKSLEKDSIVRVVNGNTEILVKKVNYVGMEEHPRGKKTSKRERELKAVIGLQEITIRNLINSLQEKAKSVQELNKTVNLARAFSSAREDVRDYDGSDVEETLNEVTDSDVTSEYKFSLTKPQPPDEVVVEDTDAVLDDIRRATEIELKDIGINRSFGRSLSHDSNLNLPNLSVHTFFNQVEETKSKKPRLLDNLDDCWPNVKNTEKESIANTKILDDNQEFDEPSIPEVHVETNIIQNDEKQISREDATSYEDYYDAYEGTDSVHFREKQKRIISEKQTETANKDESNFLMTAIIPQDMNVKPADMRNMEDTMKIDQEESPDQKAEPCTKIGKKFTCELSIDFSRKINQGPVADDNQPAIEDEKLEELQNPVCNNLDVLPVDHDNDTKREKPLVKLKRDNKCLEIEITPMDKKEISKNYVHQKMVLKFEKDSEGTSTITTNPSKFEFNLALLGLGEDIKPIKAESIESQKEETELKSLDKSKTEADMSPRTVWNDAMDDLSEENILHEEIIKEEISHLEPNKKTEEKECEPLVNSEESDFDSETDTGINDDSMRYEKNSEFLQPKTKEKDDENISKEKPSAILIQNGQTKLALIRYQ